MFDKFFGFLSDKACLYLYTALASLAKLRL